MHGRIRRFLLICQTIGLLGSIGDVCPAQDLRYFAAESWSSERGLPQNSVHSIAQTPDGYIWAATEAGLARFDGARFDVFNKTTESALTSDDLCCLLTDGSNGLWIGTSDGLLHLDRGKFVRYTEANGLPSSQIVGLTDGPDGLRVVTSVGAARWSEHDARFLQAATSAAAGIDIASTDASRTGEQWTWTANAVEVQRGTARQTWRVGRELPQGRVLTVHVDRDGLAWVGMTSGLVVVDNTKQTMTPVAAFAGMSILCIFQDKEGSYWVGTESSGLHILRRRRFRSIPALIGKAVTSVAQSKDANTWIGTRDDGVYHLKNGTLHQRISGAALTSDVILCLQAAVDGGVWAGTPDGLNQIDQQGTVRRFTSANGLPDDYIRSLIAAPDGSVWVGTRHGLVHMGGGHGETLTTLNGLGGDLIGAMLLEVPQASRSGSGLWVATSGGLSYIAPDGKITNFTVRDGLTMPIVTSLSQDGTGRLWIATDDGTFETFDGRRFHSVFALPGSRGPNSVQAIAIDASQSLWVRLERGILRIDSSHLRECLSASSCNPADDAIVHYGAADGVGNDEAVPRATAIPWLAAGGELWFPTRSGVAIADTHERATDATGPPIAIQRLLVGDASVNIADGIARIPFGRERLTMEFAALGFIAPSEVHYRYRLQGFDKEWQQAGNRRSVTYTNLAPGVYTFAVQARNNEGAWSVEGAKLEFRIVPPIYRRWWFLVLAALAALVFVFQLYLLRLRSLRRRFDAVLAERNRIARDVHDTLTQDFVSVCLQLDIVAQQLGRGQLDKAVAQVQRARQMVTDGLAEARRSIWELRNNRSQDTLPTKLARLLERDAFASIDPQLQVHGTYRAMDDRVEREILKLANEALVNVVRHAGSHHAKVDLHYRNDALVLTVEDDGVGFDMDKALEKEGHYGVLGMRERASVIGGTLEISTEPGVGTRVTLQLPVTPVGR
jgi:ligand-binding sensor domain-containing protein/two-component sensor histidine kinase